MDLLTELRELREALAWYANEFNYEDGGTPGCSTGEYDDQWECDCGNRARAALEKFRWRINHAGRLERIPCPHTYRGENAIHSVTRVGSSDDPFMSNVCGEGFIWDAPEVQGL